MSTTISMTRQRVPVAFDDMVRAEQVWHAARHTSADYKLRRECEAAIAAYNGLRDNVHNSWAATPGWRFNPKIRPIGCLVLDHAEFFEDSRRWQAGLVTHSYVGHQRIEAAQRGFLAAPLDRTDSCTRPVRIYISDLRILLQRSVDAINSALDTWRQARAENER